MEADPLSVIFVKSDSKGDRLLFRYPYEKNKGLENGQQHRRKNPYALTVSQDIQDPPPQNSESNCLANFPDEVLSNLFAVKQELCDAKFELKVNNVRFVGHPTLVQPCSRRGKSPNRPIILINVVFALHAIASHSIVKCYYELSKRLGVALRHEERRCGYVNREIKTMISAHDDRPEDSSEDGIHSPFEIILEQCSLAKDLRTIYNDLCSSGLVQIRVNRWIAVSFCLPQKVHHLNNKAISVDPEAIDKCLQSIRPYHGLLLLVDASHLLDSLVPDASPALIRLIKIYTPLKSLQTLSADADLTLAQVFDLAGHLVYWGKAIIIYPLCESNVYMTTPNAPVIGSSHLVEKFAEQFPAQSLIQVMSEFSLPTSIRQRMSPLVGSTYNDVQVIIWLLQHRLLLQLHTYIYFMPNHRGLPQQQELGGACKSEGSVAGGDTSTPSETMSVSGESASESSDEASLPTGGAVGGRQVTWDREDYLGRLSASERAAIISTPASQEQLRLFVRLILQDYLQGEHHLEEIMYMENVRRSQLLQLLDKFRDVLVTCEAEDPALAMFSPHSFS